MAAVIIDRHRAGTRYGEFFSDVIIDPVCCSVLEILIIRGPHNSYFVINSISLYTRLSIKSINILTMIYGRLLKSINVAALIAAI